MKPSRKFLQPFSGSTYSSKHVTTEWALKVKPGWTSIRDSYSIDVGMAALLINGRTNHLKIEHVGEIISLSYIGIIASLQRYHISHQASCKMADMR